MLQPSCTTGIITSGIQAACPLSDMKSDVLFLSMMKLLNAPKCSVEIRKRIIKGFRAPISEPGLAFLGKTLRDENDEVCALVFKQLTTNEVRLEHF